MHTEIVQDLISDHYCIVSELAISNTPHTSSFKNFRNIKKIDRKKFSEDLNNSLMSNCNSIDELNCILSSLLDKHAPSKYLKVRPKRDPVHESLREELTELKKQRRSAEKKWLKSRLTVHKQIFNSSKRNVAKLVQKGRTQYYTSKICSSSSNNRELHSICKHLTGYTNSFSLPTSDCHDDLPQAFSDFFNTKIDTIRHELDQMSAKVSLAPNIQDKPKSFKFDSFKKVTEDQLRKIILESKKTTCPLDPIPTTLLMEFIDNILPILTTLINDSLEKGYFPNTLKSAIVRPLLKKQTLDQNKLKNYRPVSTLSFISKIYEKVVLNQLFHFLNDNKLLSPNQSAYRAGHSTETALIKVVNDILLSLDQGNVSILMLLDLSSAFDTIDHGILFNILQNEFNITGTSFSWFKSYLSSRSQTVMIDDISSSSTPLTCGIPQGSVLGPILFIMYTKSLHDIISKYSINDQSFADDTQLYQESKPCNIDNSILNFESCFSDVKSWMCEHKLKLNDNKTEVLLLHTSNSFKNLCKPDHISLGSSDIIFSREARNLGFMMTENMTPDLHIQNVCRSAYAALRRISAIRKYLTKQTTMILICSFVLSRLDYGNALLVNSNKSAISKLQRVQNAAARLISKTKKYDHITPVLKSLHWLPVHLRIHYKLAVLCFNYFQGESPFYFSELLTIYTPKRSLRSSSDNRMLEIPSVKTKTYGQRSFSYAASTFWNTLPFSLRHTSTKASFKRKLKTHLFNQYYN